MRHDVRPELRDPEAPSPPGVDSFLWSDARLLGYTPMDETHEEFYAVAFGLLSCDASTMHEAIEAFEKHALEHFGQEDEWMQRTGFPPRECHIAEHKAIMESLQGVREALESGQHGCELVHDFAVHLFQWFPGHAEYLDSALAAWMTKRSLGGKPVVLRRSIGGTRPR